MFLKATNAACLFIIVKFGLLVGVVYYLEGSTAYLTKSMRLQKALIINGESLKTSRDTVQQVGEVNRKAFTLNSLGYPGMLLLGMGILFSAFSPLGFTLHKIHFWKKQQAVMAALSPEDGRLCQFRLAESAFREVRVNDREIQVRGIMYDIYSIEKVGDSLLVSALADYEESHWLSVQLYRSDSAPPSEEGGTFVFLFYFFQIVSRPICLLSPPDSASPGECIAAPSTVAVSVPAPPPWLLSCAFQ